MSAFCAVAGAALICGGFAAVAAGVWLVADCVAWPRAVALLLDEAARCGVALACCCSVVFFLAAAACAFCAAWSLDGCTRSCCAACFMVRVSSLCCCDVLWPCVASDVRGSGAAAVVFVVGASGAWL